MPSPSLQWLGFVATIWLQSVNGPNSDFPVYSSQLKHILSISQVQLNTLAFASDAGKIFGWCSGIAAVYLPLRLVLLIGSFFGLIGYGVQYLFLWNMVSHLSYWHVIVLTALAGNGICWINTACYLICARNFPRDSRVAAGLSTSYVGLSARVYTALVDFIFDPAPGEKAKAYIMLNAIAPVIVSFVTVPFLSAVEDDGEERFKGGGFMGVFVITVTTGICAVFGSIGSGRGWSPAHMVSLGTLLLAPGLVPLYMKVREWREERLRNNKQQMRVPVLIIDVVVEYGKGVEELNSKDEGVLEVEKVNEEDVGFCKLVRKLDFWLYFFSYMFGGTLGLVFLNNLGQIAESRGISNTSSLVSLASSFGFFGRLMPPLVDYFLSKKGYMLPRPAFMATMMAPMAGAFLLLLNSRNVSLFIGTAVIGASSGSITSIAVSATPDLFGMKNFALNHNLVVANIPIGSFLFGYFAAVLYQNGGRGESCMGERCYYQTFIIWGVVCALGTLLCCVLHFRTRSKERVCVMSHEMYVVTTGRKAREVGACSTTVCIA